MPPGGVSLPRALSKLGFCSRAQSLAFIAGGRVTVDGVRETNPARRVDLRRDRVAVDGRERPDGGERVVIAFHKPRGVVTTRADPQGRPTVYDLLPAFDRFVFPVGRLDLDTAGLLIFTDDHRLGETLTGPDHGVVKTYRVEVDRSPDDRALEALRRGVNIGRGETTRPADVSMDERAERPTLVVRLGEGRNRQVRRMCAAVGLGVVSLTRTAIGGVALGDLPPGRWRRLSPAEVAALSGAAWSLGAVRPRRPDARTGGARGVGRRRRAP